MEDDPTWACDDQVCYWKDREAAIRHNQANRHVMKSLTRKKLPTQNSLRELETDDRQVVNCRTDANFSGIFSAGRRTDFSSESFNCWTKFQKNTRNEKRHVVIRAYILCTLSEEFWKSRCLICNNDTTCIIYMTRVERYTEHAVTDKR
jgi:hypothetical protein